jgi:type IV pilus assembly protein PilM
MSAFTQLPPPAASTGRFKYWFNSPPPQIAVEIAASRLIVARGDLQSGQVLQVASKALPEGLVTPSLTHPNLAEPDTISSLLRGLLEQMGGIDQETILLAPDLTARVALLEFEQVPAKPAELDALVRFRLRKTLPFDADHAALSCQVLGRAPEQKVLVTVAERARLDEYEQCLEAAGAHAGILQPASLAAMAASPALEHGCLLLRAVDGCLTTAFAWSGVLQLYRVLETDPAGPSYDDIFPSVAYFRDFWESHAEDAEIHAASHQPRVITAGLSDEVMEQLRAEIAWASITPGRPTQADATAAPAAHLLSIAGALSNVR